MADGKELKPKSFRIDDETAEKFKEISGRIGGNQQETLAKLIEAYEFQQGKAILTGKKDDIDQFDRYVGAITRMYMGALEDNQQLTETVRAEYDAQLRSKDDIIRDLQDRLKKAQETAEQAVAQADELTSQCSALTGQIEELTGRYTAKIADLQAMIADKDGLNKALTDSCSDLKSRLDAMQAAVDQVAELEKKVTGLEHERDHLSRKQKEHEREMTGLRDQNQLDKDKALLEQERKYQDQINQIKVDHQAQIDEYQRKYRELLDQMQHPTTKK